jgi:hypothetical protein
MPPAFGRLVRHGGVDHQGAGESEHHAAGRGPRDAEPLNKAARPRAQLRQPEVLHELGPDSLENQNQASDHDNQADDAD